MAIKHNKFLYYINIATCFDFARPKHVEMLISYKIVVCDGHLFICNKTHNDMFNLKKITFVGGAWTRICMSESRSMYLLLLSLCL